ncbi:MAG: hypothetical protein FWG91_13165 [Lachnospiraceae bacterium]|nr:hypothetical protein [Lachnospiraceae bacterium]
MEAKQIEFEKRLKQLEDELSELRKFNEELKDIRLAPANAPAKALANAPIAPIETPIKAPIKEETAQSVRDRIILLRTKSSDLEFNQYLTQLLNDLDTNRASLDFVSSEINRVYSIYLEINGKELSGNKEINGNKEVKESNEYNEFVGFSEQPSQHFAKEDNTAGAEYTVGATIIGIVGAVFLLVGFITFGLNYLTGIWQGIFLYLLSAVIILCSELYVKRKLPKFADALTGLGISALYGSTIINYFYMKTFGSLAAAIVTLLIAAFSVLLSRRKDSAMMRLISFIGCYICFLTVVRFQNQLEFLVASGILFLVNIASVYLPSQKHSEVIHKVQMGLNTIFILVFAALARNDGVMDIYIILCLVLNIVLLNIICMNQKKDLLATVLFGIELSALSIMILGVLFDLTHPFQLMAHRIYYLLLVYALILAVGISFYILNRDKIGKIYQSYFLIIFSLLLLTRPLDKEYIWGMLILFVIAKALSRAKEYEPLNALVTIAAFGVGIHLYNEWQTWLFAGAAILSIPLIKRWRLFYQYATSLYLIFFIALLPGYDKHFLPAAALLLFTSVLVFRYLVRAKDGADDEKYQMIYNVTCLAAIGLISFLCIDNYYDFVAPLVALIGAVSIILYVNPAFFIKFKKKYLLLLAYLAFMTLVVRFPNPVYASLILMLIAVVCVGIGFMIHDKAQRISGLVLAIFVCLKISLYDFQALVALQRTVVFIIVGIFALLISLLYIHLEKVNKERQNNS